MVEGQMDPWFDLIDGKVVRQIGADPPILFVRSLVVNPSATWCLEKRVNQQQ
jgi:hypothetical protein